MPAPLRATVSDHECAMLSDLRIADSVPYRVRDRAHMVLMSADGWNAPALAKAFSCHEHTVRTAIKRWNESGLFGLWDKEGRGSKAKWQPEDLDYLIDRLNQEERTYNSSQLAVKLWEERQVKLSADRIRRLLKKRTIGGSAPATAIETDRTQPPKRSQSHT